MTWIYLVAGIGLIVLLTDIAPKPAGWLLLLIALYMLTRAGV